MESKDLRFVFDALLTAPGMNDLAKLDVKISRKLILLLVELIERGQNVKGNGLAECSDDQLKEELKSFVGATIERADLTALHGKIKQMEK